MNWCPLAHPWEICLPPIRQPEPGLLERFQEFDRGNRYTVILPTGQTMLRVGVVRPRIIFQL